MQKNILISFVLLLNIFVGASINPAHAEGFPGKGDRFAWSAAIPYYNLANKYLEHGRYDEAVQNYEEAIYHYEYDPDFYINYGVALRKREDYGGAEQAFKKSIQLRSSDWQAWSNLANACLKQNRLKETVNCFEKAMKCQPPPPAPEKAAMLKDMADIARIMSMQQAPPLARNPSLAQKQSSATVGKKNKVSSAEGTGNTSETAHRSESSAAAGSESESQQKGDLSKSGWDWVN